MPRKARKAKDLLFKSQTVGNCSFGIPSEWLSCLSPRPHYSHEIVSWRPFALAHLRSYKSAGALIRNLFYWSLVLNQPLFVLADVVEGVSSGSAGLHQNAAGANSGALGQCASALQASAFAIGTKANASGTNSLSIGREAFSGAEGAIGIGALSNAVAAQAVAIGSSANGNGSQSVAIGSQSRAGAQGSAFGQMAKANGSNASAVGSGAIASDTQATAVGFNSSASGSNATAVGSTASSSGDDASAFGQASKANGSNSLALGSKAIANTTQAIAVGFDTLANGSQSIAIGAGSRADGISSLAMGYSANASANNSIAIGRSSQSAGANSIAIGFEAISQLQSIAIGLQANATGSCATAIGPSSYALGTNSLALGTGARVNASATRSVALGSGAVVGTSATNSVAFGPGAFVTNSNTFAMGVENSIFQFNSLTTPSGYFSSVPQPTTTNATVDGTIWSVVNQTYSDGKLSASNSTWYRSPDGATPSSTNLSASGSQSNIYKVTTTTVLSSSQNMTAISYNRSISPPTVTGAGCNATLSCVKKSTSGNITTYKTYPNNSSTSASSVTAVDTSPVGVAYGAVSSSGASYVVSAYNSKTNFSTVTTTSHNASLNGSGWANATGTFSSVLVDAEGKLYITPHETSSTSKYITNGQFAAMTTVYNSTSAISNKTNCTSGGVKASCNPPAPRGNTTVTSTSSSSSSASIGGWRDPVSSISDAQSRVADLISHFKGSSMAYGASSDATGANNIAYGHGSQAHGNHSNNISFGTSAESDGTNGVAFGAGSRSDGVNALAFGASSRAEGNRVISLGSGSITNGTDAVALGATASSIGTDAMALGARSSAAGNRVMSLGSSSRAEGTDAFAIGTGSTANGQQALAIGDNAEANGVGVIAIGSGAKALGSNTNGLAIGTQATASGTDVTALGAGASATGIRSTAVGAGAQASHTDSTAIGAGARTTAPGQVVLGTTTSSVVIPSLGGSGKFAGRASQQGSTRVVTTDASGNLGTSFNPKLMEQSISDIARATQSSAAIAAAFSSVPSMTQLNGEPARCGFGTGGFGSQYAIAGGCAVKISESFFLNGALSYTPSINYNFGDTPSVAGRIGFSFPLGRIAKTKPAEVLNKEVINTIQTQQKEISELKAMVMTLRSQILELQNE